MKYRRFIPYFIIAIFILIFNKTINYHNIIIKEYLNYTELIRYSYNKNFYENDQIVQNSLIDLRKNIKSNNPKLNSNIQSIHTISSDVINASKSADNATDQQALDQHLKSSSPQAESSSGTRASLLANGGVPEQDGDETRGDVNNDVTKPNEDAVEEVADDGTKTILIYTKFYGAKWHRFPGFDHFSREQCREQRCKFTFDRNLVASADAVIFSAVDFNHTDVPHDRKSSQRYIWYNMEAPGRGIIRSRVFNRHLLEANRFGADGFFNWSMTYHRSSDIVDFYGAFRDIYDPKSQKQAGILDRKSAAFNSYSTTIDNYLSTNNDSEKNNIIESVLGDKWQKHNTTRKKTVAWMVSHCVTDSGRELYIEQLQKYLSVDIYGDCGPLSCGRNHLDRYCWGQLAQKYYFYLAFENNMCQDYITEKVWEPLEAGLVPVVYGGANYSQYLPPGSYVDARNMQPKDLAKFLKRVSSSPLEYASYHLWRRYWSVISRPPVCDLCSKLHEDKKTSVLMDIPTWYREINQCFTDYRPLTRMNFKGSKNPIKYWMTYSLTQIQ